MNYLNTAVINTPVPAVRRRKQTYEVGGTGGNAEWQHLYVGGGGDPYPPMPDLGGGLHSLPGVENWFDPLGLPRPIAAVEQQQQQQVPFAANVGVAAEGLVALKKPPASSSARVSRKKSTASSTRARTPKPTRKSSGGYRTPAKPIASVTTTTTTTTAPGRTPAPDIGPDWTVDRVPRSDYKENKAKGNTRHGQFYKYWYSPWGHKFKTLIEVKLFQDALKRLEGGDHEGNEDIARETVKLAAEAKVENGGTRMVLTDAIIEDAISKAEGGDLDKARGHVVIVKRNCSVLGCTRHRKSGGMCRKHHEEEKKKSAATDIAATSSRRSRSCPPCRPGTIFEVNRNISPLSRPFLPPTDADHPPTVPTRTDDDELVAATTDTNELGTDDTSDQGGGYFDDSDESYNDISPLPDDGSPLANANANGTDDAQEIVLIDSDFLRLINKIPKLPNTDGVPLEDLTVSSTGSNFEVKATPPPSPTLSEIAALSDTEPSPPLKGSPLKDFSNGSAETLIIEDRAYSDAINGPISEYCQQFDWVDEESNNLAWNRLDWGDIEGTPTPGKKTPTARSWKGMIIAKESGGRLIQLNRLDTPAPSGTPALPRIRGGDPRRQSLGSLLGDVVVASTPPRRRRSTRISTAL